MSESESQGRRIRICHFTTVQRPNDVRMYHRECVSLAKAGFEVHLVVPNETSQVRDSVRIHGIRKPSCRFTRILFLPLVAMKAALKTRAHIYHFHDPELLLVGFLMRWVLGRKVVFDMRESTARQIMGKEWLPAWSRRFISWGYRIIESICRRGLSVVVANDRSVAENEPCYLVRNFPEIDEQFMASVVPMKERMKKPTLIYVGGVWEGRGALIYLELCKRLVQRGRDIRLVIIGPHEESFGERLRAFVDTHKLHQHVTITGYVDYKKAMELMASSVIGLAILQPIPNYTFCLAGKITEYMMCGTPVLCSHFNHWRFPYVETERTGRTVDPGDMDEIVTVCESMLDKPQELEAMGERGMEAVRRRYNWTIEFQELLRCYNDLLKR